MWTLKEIDHKIYICLEIIYIKHFMCISNSHHRERYDKYPVLLLAFHAIHYYYGIVRIYLSLSLSSSNFFLYVLERAREWKCLQSHWVWECEMEICHAMAHTKYSEMSNKWLVTGKKVSTLYDDYPNTLCFQ